MTATEVIQRTEERFRLMGPWLGRVMTALGTMLFRVYNIGRRAGRIPPPPEDIRGTPMKLIFTSPIARAQEQIEANGLLRAQELVLPMVDRDPTIADVFNGDETARGIYEIFNVSQRYLRTDKEVKAIRQSRAQQQSDKMEAENLRDAGQGLQSVVKASEGLKNAEILDFTR